MARAPDPRIEEAKVMYLKGRKLIEIARDLNIPEGTVRRWKNQDKWDMVTLPNVKGNVAKKNRGGQPGNRNAAGSRGGAEAVARLKRDDLNQFCGKNLL